MQLLNFLDTNILLYAISNDESEVKKKEIARNLLMGNDWGVSVQVLQEFYVNAVREKRPSKRAAMTVAEAAEAVRRFTAYPVVANTDTLLLKAIDISKRSQISFWDASVIAAAIASGAKTLYTEDLNDGQTYETITVVNPFLSEVGKPSNKSAKRLSNPKRSRA
jgi:predicted nucleic acid-binding protein